MSAAHTKTPWRAGRGCVVADVPVPGMGGSDAVEYYGGHLVAESIVAENVEFIVRACNNHDALVQILKTTAGNIRSLGPAGALDQVPVPYRIWLEEVEKALTAAGAA